MKYYTVVNKGSAESMCVCFLLFDFVCALGGCSDNTAIKKWSLSRENEQEVMENSKEMLQIAGKRRSTYGSICLIKGKTKRWVRSSEWSSGERAAGFVSCKRNAEQTRLIWILFDLVSWWLKEKIEGTLEES